MRCQEYNASVLGGRTVCTGPDSLRSLWAPVSFRHSLTGSSPAIGFIGATPIPKSGVRGRRESDCSDQSATFLTCAVFAYVSRSAGSLFCIGRVKLAVAVWLIGPLPLILTNAAFMKLHRVFVASYAIGWLIKLMIVAVAVGWFLR